MKASSVCRWMAERVATRAAMCRELSRGMHATASSAARSRTCSPPPDGGRTSGLAARAARAFAESCSERHDAGTHRRGCECTGVVFRRTEKDPCRPSERGPPIAARAREQVGNVVRGACRGRRGGSGGVGGGIDADRAPGGRPQQCGESPRRSKGSGGVRGCGPRERIAPGRGVHLPFAFEEQLEGQRRDFGERGYRRGIAGQTDDAHDASVDLERHISAREAALMLLVAVDQHGRARRGRLSGSRMQRPDARSIARGDDEARRVHDIDVVPQGRRDSVDDALRRRTAQGRLHGVAISSAPQQPSRSTGEASQRPPTAAPHPSPVRPHRTGVRCGIAR